MFSTYEQEFKQGIEQINKIQEGINQMSYDKKEKSIKFMKNQQVELEKLFKQLEIEMMNVDLGSKSTVQSKVRQFKQELDQVRKNVKISEENYILEKNRDILIGNNEDNDKTERLIKQGQLLSNQNMKLYNAKQTALQAEETAIDIQLNLHNNSESIKKSIKKTKEMNYEFSSANQLISKMSSRAFQRRMVLYGTLFVVGLIFLLIIYLKYA